jgi:hypothetical protein
MTKREPAQYRAKVTNDSGLVRAKIPSPLIRELGGRPGDYMVFHYDGSPRVSMNVARTEGGAKATSKSRKTVAGKARKKR